MKKPDHRTLDYYYSKQCYQKTVKRLMEDPGSIWYDGLEQIKKDYQEMKEGYDIINALNPEEPQMIMEQPQSNLEEEVKSAQNMMRRGTQIKGQQAE